jgi:hypothetical protein
MKTHITYQADKYIRYKIEEYIYETFLKASDKEKDKLIEILIELYFYLENKGDQQQIQARKLQTKWRIVFLNERRRYSFLLNLLGDMDLIKRGKSYSTGLSYEKGKVIYKPEEPYCKSLEVRDLTEDIFKEDLEYKLDIKKIFDEVELKDKDYWLNKYRAESNIINMIYESYYDIEEVKDHLYKRIGQYTKKGRLIDNILINSYINRAIKYNARIYNFIKTDEGRFYNPTSYQPSTIRHLLKMDGDYLIELDTKNSQPLLLGQYINNREYKDAVEKGTFYDTLKDEIGGTREHIKVMTMKFIFFNKSPLKSGKLYKAMKKHFGDTIDQINEIKKDQELWQLLQKDEADIFINELTGDYISIHDSVLVKRSEMKHFLNKLMLLYKQRGLKATIK